jgi:hypothetical protein
LTRSIHIESLDSHLPGDEEVELIVVAYMNHLLGIDSENLTDPLIKTGCFFHFTEVRSCGKDMIKISFETRCLHLHLYELLPGIGRQDQRESVFDVVQDRIDIGIDRDFVDELSHQAFPVLLQPEKAKPIFDVIPFDGSFPHLSIFPFHHLFRFFKGEAFLLPVKHGDPIAPDPVGKLGVN